MEIVGRRASRLQLFGFASPLVDWHVLADIGCNSFAAFCEINQLGAHARVMRSFGEFPELRRLPVQVSDAKFHRRDHAILL
jgi:hypothetical protein